MDAAEALRRAKELAVALSMRRGEVGKVATKILALLDTASQELVAEKGGAQARPSKRGDAEIEYRVEKTTAGETLAEHRTSGASQPFRCPRPVYDAIAQVLASATGPLPLEDIAAAVAAKAGVTPGDYQLRVPLRLWLSVTPPLIVRHRARYRAADQAFLSGTKGLWERLKAPPG